MLKIIDKLHQKLYRLLYLIDEKSKQDKSNNHFDSDIDNGLNNTKTMISHENIDDEEEDIFYNQTSEIESERRRTPNEWNVEEVCDFVTALVGSEIAGQFKWHDIDGQALDYLNVENLFNLMRIKLGPACRIKSHFDQVKRAYLDSIKFDNSN